MLGLGDEQPTPWNGQVKLDRGEVVGLEGWRFREGDLVTGPEAWRRKAA